MQERATHPTSCLQSLEKCVMVAVVTAFFLLRVSSGSVFSVILLFLDIFLNLAFISMASLEKIMEQGPVDPGSPAKSSEGSTTEALGDHQTPNMVKSVLEDDDLEWIWKEYGILESIILEVSNLW